MQTNYNYNNNNNNNTYNNSGSCPAANPRAKLSDAKYARVRDSSRVITLFSGNPFLAYTSQADANRPRSSRVLASLARSYSQGCVRCRCEGAKCDKTIVRVLYVPNTSLLHCIAVRCSAIRVLSCHLALHHPVSCSVAQWYLIEGWCVTSHAMVRAFSRYLQMSTPNPPTNITPTCIA